MGKRNNQTFDWRDMSSEDEDIDLDGLHEQQARAVPRLANRRVLLLNADYQPMSYKPLSTVPWTTAFFWLAKGWNRMAEGKPPIIHVVSEYDDYVHTGTTKFRVPAIVALTKMAAMPERAPFNRANLYLRDDYTCQYSGIKYPISELTLDHVMPQSRGGKTNWTNLVTCHKKINFDKADKTPKEAGLRLKREPYVPSAWELREKGRSYPSRFDHHSWADYVYYNVELEKED